MFGAYPLPEGLLRVRALLPCSIFDWKLVQSCIDLQSHIKHCIADQIKAFIDVHMGIDISSKALAQALNVTDPSC